MWNCLVDAFGMFVLVDVVFGMFVRFVGIVRKLDLLYFWS